MNDARKNKITKGMRSRVLGALKAIVLILLAYQLLYPLLYMVSMSIRTPEDVLNPSLIWIPNTFTLSNFKEAFRVMDYWDVLKHSLVIGVGTGLLNVISCSFVAYGFARFKFPGVNLLFGLVIFTLIVPKQTIILPLYTEMRFFDFFGLLPFISSIFGGPESINLVGSYSSFFLPSMFGLGLHSGLFIFIFRQYFKGLPRELEDAAYIDGSGPFRTFFKVILPNAKNSIITVFIFSFVWQWNEYYLSNLFLGTQKQNFAVALSSLRVDLESVLQMQTISDPLALVTRIQAGSLLVILPVFILYLITQRFLTESIEHTTLK